MLSDTKIMWLADRLADRWLEGLTQAHADIYAALIEDRVPLDMADQVAERVIESAARMMSAKALRAVRTEGRA